MSLFRSSLLILGVLSMLPDSLPAADPPIDPAKLEFFEKNVRPLFVKHCYKCHSSKAKELKGGLNLDLKQGWIKGGDTGPAIVAGKPDESLLIESIRYDELEMPPDGKLPAAAIAVFEKWVATGAADPRVNVTKTPNKNPGIDFEKARRFWAFQLPKPHRAPNIQNNTWPLDDIDRFILARLEARGLSPNQDADKSTWLRRVTFDLTGLPPTVDEIAAFQADESLQAHATVVDRLLASVQFGQHWGRHWLDVARYADSNGSDFNATFFNAWRYRNYVVDAFNNDKPFDQFVREQLAGDLLPYDSDEQRAEQLIGTGFLMIGPKMLSERDKEKLEMDVIDEQIDSVGRAFMGLTLGCARCHEHKFDPIPTEDYYALAGIFRSTIILEGESQQYVSTWKSVGLPMEKQHAAALEKHKQAKTKVESDIKAAKKDLKAAQAKLARIDISGKGIIVDNTQAKLVGEWKDSKFSPHFYGKGYIHDDKTGKGQKSVTFIPDLPKAGRYEVRISYAGGGGRDNKVPVSIKHVGNTKNISVDQTKPAPINKLFKSLGTFRFEAGKAGSVTILTTGTTGHVIADAAQFIPLDDAIAASRAERDKVTAARNSVNSLNVQIKQLEAELKQLAKNAPPPAPQAFAVREAKRIVNCELRIRGEVHRHGPAIERGFLRICDSEHTKLANKKQSGRAELADWIARADHPLTSRVIVNRIWSYLLGEGIVRSIDNFGHLGQRPTHPKLLDTLAVNFVESGWSVKRMIRRIVLSRVYRLSSQHNRHATAADPENRLLWRAHRKRLPAEAVRDSMLAVSGQLDLTPAASPVKGLGRLAIDNSKQGSSGKSENSLRRSLYLPMIRNDLPAFLTVFDFTDPDVVTGKRPLTNVPAQALTLLNSPFVKQSARKMTERIVAASNDDDRRVERIYLTLLARQPNDAERKRAFAFVTDLTKNSDITDDESARPTEVWRQFIHAVMASTEFRMLN